MGTNAIIFGADMISSVHVDNKNKDILILGEGSTPGLDDMALSAEAKYRINFTQPDKRFVLILHCNGSNSFLFVNDTKIYQFKGKKLSCAEVIFQKLFLHLILILLILMIF